MDTMKYIRDLLLKHKYKYVLGIVFLICVDVLQLIMPWILGDATNFLESGGMTRERLAWYAIAVTLTALGIAVFRFLFRYTLYGVSRSFELSFRNRLYAHLQKLSVNWFNTHKTGDLMAHATNDMNNVTMATGQGVIFAVDCLLLPVASLVMMWRTGGFKLMAASFAPLLFLSIVTFFFMKIMQSTVQKQQEAFSNMTETARENFSGIRVIKSFVQEQQEIERFRKANDDNRKINLKFTRLMSMMFPSVMLVASLSYVIAIWYGGVLVIQGSISLGSFVAFNSYLGMLIWPITALGWVANIFQRGSVSLQRINVLLDEKPEIADRETAVTSNEGSAAGTDDGSAVNADKGSATGTDDDSAINAGKDSATGTDDGSAVNAGKDSATGTDDDSAVNADKDSAGSIANYTSAGSLIDKQPLSEGDIEFRDLTFTYPGSSSPVLENISLTIKKGRTLAIIGRTGSGKSTLINLVPRLLSVPDGTLFIDGRDINDIPLSSLRSSIGCVPQETFLFSDTISNNIDFYRGFDMDEIEKASKVARLHDNIVEFPKRFDTIVGERGVTLSGGQKQRTAIARAVLGSPSILILDDCLSAVDAKTEESILRDLKILMKQRTSIIVSHRISAVKDADVIIVLDEGRIIEQGDHVSLIRSEGYYHDLYTRQLLADEIEEAE